jgi:hypothetical protein
LPLKTTAGGANGVALFTYMMLGKLVHFVLNVGPNKGAHRAAFVVAVKNEYTVSLQVLSDGTKSDGDFAPNMFYKRDAVKDETGHSPGTWHEAESVTETT